MSRFFTRDGPLHVALARRHDGKEYWLVVSDEPTELKTCEASGLHFDMEDNSLEDKSNGLQ
jgi:hypothetical protein